MPDIIYRFRNDVFGGNHDVTLASDEMPNWFPIDEEVRQNSHIADTGKLWQYTWFRRKKWELQFEHVGTALAATFGSFALEDTPILWYTDVGTGTVTFTGGFRQVPIAPNIVGFQFTVREA